MAKEFKSKEQFQQHPKDTGSVEVQIVDLTNDIHKLTEHVKVNKKDYSTKLGLLKKVSRRRKLLGYIKRKNQDVYTKLLSTLGLKK